MQLESRAVIAVDGESNERLILTFERPPFVGFITEAEKRPQLEEIVAGLEAAAG